MLINYKNHIVTYNHPDTLFIIFSYFLNKILYIPYYQSILITNNYRHNDILFFYFIITFIIMHIIII